MIAWDSGTAIEGNADLAGGADIVRVVLDTIPDYQSQNGDNPIRYGFLGRVGWIDGDSRDTGQPLYYADQELVPVLPQHDGVYYSLAVGVSGTLYKGTIDMPPSNVVCVVRRTTAQTITTGVITPVSFDAEVTDPYDLHSNSVEPTRITVQTPGTYTIIGLVGWTINVAARIAVWIRLNGVTALGSTVYHAAAGDSTVDQQASCVTPLEAGDYVELICYQATGSDKSIFSYQTRYPSLQLVRVGG